MVLNEVAIFKRAVLDPVYSKALSEGLGTNGGDKQSTVSHNKKVNTSSREQNEKNPFKSRDK
jgi:hypothetical protein